jgi:hypothetical protein
MRNLLKNIRFWVLIWISILVTLLMWWMIYAVINNVWTSPDELEAKSWDSLTSEAWNKILANQKALSGAISQLQISWWSTTIEGDVINIYWESNENMVWTEIFWDENEIAKAACNARVKAAVWSQYSANDWWNWANWIWVPARSFTTDWEGISLDENYYKRPIQYNWTNYICKWFAVMKYEASNVTSIPVSDYATASRVSLTMPTAISACRSLWRAYTKKWEFHVMTNNERMAIARNIEQQDSNWSSWTKLNWFVCNWNIAWSDYSVIPANNDVTELAKACSSNTADNRRALKLSNGAVIWDLSWNSWEFVNKANTINWAWFNQWQTQVWLWVCTNDTWTAVPWCWVNWKASAEEMAKYWPALIVTWTNWGAGNFYDANWVANNIFLRGGRAADGANVGIYVLGVARTTTIYAADVSFRCVL